MRIVYNILTTLVLIGGGVAAWLLPGGDNDGTLIAAAPSAAMQRRQAIAFYERRLREDPRSALDMAQLAALQMEEGRMSGDERAFVVAESLVTRSLGERTNRNGRSAAVLATALLAQHRFAEADSVARELVTSEPDQPAYRALLAETAMELGDYDDAIRQLGTIRERRADLGIAPRFARWAELTGRPGEARRILLNARREAGLRGDLTGEQRAWFSLRLADVELRHGNLRTAALAIDEGFNDSPGDWRLLLARARLESHKRQWKKAVASAEDVLTQISSPEALAILADAHREQGHTDDAIAFEQALQQVTLSKPGSVHRSWSMSLLDNQSQTEQVPARAVADTVVRHDMHTLDLLAWALYRSGRTHDAVPIMRRAVALGSVEAVLRYHAALIEFAAGDAQLGEEHRRIALSRAGALTKAQISELREASGS